MTEKRIIKCPVCRKGKFVDLYKSSGRNSVACEKCHQFIELDWDNMTARQGEQIKRVS